MMGRPWTPQEDTGVPRTTQHNMALICYIPSLLLFLLPHGRDAAAVTKLSNLQDRANQKVQIEEPQWKQKEIYSWWDLSLRTEIIAQPSPRHSNMRDQKQPNRCCKSKMTCTNQKRISKLQVMKGDKTCDSSASCRIEEQLKQSNLSSNRRWGRAGE